MLAARCTLNRLIYGIGGRSWEPGGAAGPWPMSPAMEERAYALDGVPDPAARERAGSEWMSGEEPVYRDVRHAGREDVYLCRR
jgi:hypothetical protein